MDHINLQDLKRIAEQGASFWHPSSRDKENRGICYIFPKFMNSNLFQGPQAIKNYLQFSYWLSAHASAASIENDRKGFVYIEDFRDASFASLFSVASSSEIKEMFDSIQNSIPNLIKRIYLLNAPWYVYMLMAIVRPFLSVKIQKRVQLIDEQSLQQLITPENLLKITGGNLDFNSNDFFNFLFQQNKDIYSFL